VEAIRTKTFEEEEQQGHRGMKTHSILRGMQKAHGGKAGSWNGLPGLESQLHNTFGTLGKSFSFPKFQSHLTHDNLNELLAWKVVVRIK
jgi:hypothetical protein